MVVITDPTDTELPIENDLVVNIIVLFFMLFITGIKGFSICTFGFFK